MFKPIISVILPAYNAEKTIAESISSVLCQTFSSFELLIIDDGSTDNTREIISRFNDDRIFYYFQENKERALARNLGISYSKGNFIAFIDADDLWHPDKLHLQLEIISNNKEIGLVYSDLYYFDSGTDDNIYRYGDKFELYRGNNCLEPLLWENFIQSPTPLVRKELFHALGGFDNELIPVEDWEMWIRIASRYPIDYCDTPLARYRVHQNSTSWGNNPDQLYLSTLKMFDKIESHLLPQISDKHLKINKYRAKVHYIFASEMRSRRNYNKSIEAYQLAIRFNSILIKAYIRLLQVKFKHQLS